MKSRLLATGLMGGFYVICGLAGLTGLPSVAVLIASHPLEGHLVLFVVLGTVFVFMPLVAFFTIADIWGFNPRILGLGLRKETKA